MLFQIEIQMKKMAEQIFFLVHAQKFSRNIYLAKNLHTKQSDSFYEETSRKRLRTDKS